MAKLFTKEFLKLLPKIELHLHLDCSLSFDCVSQLQPEISYNQFRRNFIAPLKCTDLADFLKCTMTSIELMQTEKNLNQIVYDLFNQLQNENVKYTEIRFAPLLHTQEKLSPEHVVEIVSEAFFQNASRTGINAGLILCTLRHFSEADSLKTIELVNNYIHITPVCGFDIAADEAGFPIDNHKSAFEYAIKNDIPRTAHAGEARGPQSMWETLKHFQPSRIGHGVRGIEDKQLIEYLINNNLHLEICPTCNIQTDIFQSHSEHPVDTLFKSGVSLGINTDARTLSNITLTQEYTKLQQKFGWGLQEFKQININAINHAFVDSSTKNQLIDDIIQAYTDK